MSLTTEQAKELQAEIDACNLHTVQYQTHVEFDSCAIVPIALLVKLRASLDAYVALAAQHEQALGAYRASGHEEDCALFMYEILQGAK